jgi:hypothetical protein
MKRYVRIGMLMGAAMLATVPSAFAQFWGRESTPRNGACFYEDVEYRGRYFCTPTGRDIANLPGNMNDQISSIRLFGNAEVRLFRDTRFEGQERVIANDVPDLRRMKFNDRISSYVVDNARGFDRGRNARDNDTYRNGVPQRWPNGNGQVNGNSRWNYREAQNIVTNAYRSVLRRDPDQAGLRSWTQQVMENNWTQRDLENRLRDSEEYRQMVRGARRR